MDFLFGRIQLKIQPNSAEKKVHRNSYNQSKLRDQMGSMEDLMKNWNMKDLSVTLGTFATILFNIFS